MLNDLSKSDHPNITWGLRRLRTRSRQPHQQTEEPNFDRDLGRSNLAWGSRRRRTRPPHVQLQASRRHENSVPTRPPAQSAIAGTTSTVVAPLQANLNATDIPAAGRPLITVFGYEDHNVQLTKQFMCKKNVNIVIREESELNIMLKDKQRKLQASTSYIGKGKGKENQPPASVDNQTELQSGTSYIGNGKGKENQAPAPVSWDDKAAELTRINSTKNRGWGINNKIFIETHVRWPYYVEVDTLTFRKLMHRKYGGY